MWIPSTTLPEPDPLFPEHSHAVLVWDRLHRVWSSGGYDFGAGRWWSDEHWKSDITHWMPVPAPPADGEYV
jgi:hypothetical protein